MNVRPELVPYLSAAAAALATICLMILILLAQLRSLRTRLQLKLDEAAERLRQARPIEQALRGRRLGEVEIALE